MSLKDTYFSFKKDLEEKMTMRIAAFGLAILCAWFMYVLLADYRAEFLSEYTDKYKRFEELERLQKEVFWEARARESQNVLASLKGKLWPLENDGLARANFQGFLSNIAQKSGIKKPVVNVEQAKFDKNFPGFKKLVAVLTGFAEPETIEKFLSDLLKQDRRVIVQDLEFSSPPPKSFRTALVVYMPEEGSKK